MKRTVIDNMKKIVIDIDKYSPDDNENCAIIEITISPITYYQKIDDKNVIIGDTILSTTGWIDKIDVKIIKKVKVK
jgi:hypothetical protein